MRIEFYINSSNSPHYSDELHVILHGDNYKIVQYALNDMYGHSEVLVRRNEMMQRIKIFLTDPYVGLKIKDRFGNKLVERANIKSFLKNNKFGLGFGEAYQGEVDKNSGTLFIESELLKSGGVTENVEGIIPLALFISILELNIREQIEFKKDPQAYEKKVKAGGKVFEVTENDVDLDKMIEEFKEKHKQLLDLNNNEPRLNNKPTTKKWYEFWKK